MSGRKQSGHLTKSERLNQMARKRDERHVRATCRKEKKMNQYLGDDENFTSFSAQLAKMGCQLRDIPGDGNCLFRALGDQYEGHGRNHYKHRLEVCQYMHEHRADFEPFVEDDVPFDRHLLNLRKLGTYAGNDAIVAFARLHAVNVIIHQYNTPFLSINGSSSPNCRELHISYHNGDHYSSIRKIGDNTETPANIKVTKQAEPAAHSNGYTNGFERYSPEPDYYSTPEASVCYSNGNESDYDNVPSTHQSDDGYVARAIRGKGDVEMQVMKVTGCHDREMVIEALEENFYDVDSTVAYLLTVLSTDNKSQFSTQTDSGIWSENGSASRIFGSTDPEPIYATVDKSRGAKPKDKALSAKEMKKLKKLEKKTRASDRHRERLGTEPTAATYSAEEEDEYNMTVISNTMGMVKI